MNYLYTIEKLRELEQARMSKLAPGQPREKTRRKPIFGPLATGAGRTLRRLGEGLESWGAPAPREAERRVANQPR